MYKAKCKILTLVRYLELSAAALVLAACDSGKSSDELATNAPLDLALAQCEIALDYQTTDLVGSPIDPVLINGVETQACQLNTDAVEVAREIKLKNTHNYEPLIWVLDGVYEVGQSKAYNTLSDYQADIKTQLFGSTLYAKEGTVVIVHRNASVEPNIFSLDDNAVGGGEWGGVVVNSIGIHSDCPAGAGANKFCNIEGPWGYYGGMPEGKIGGGFRPGFNGSVAEAGGPISGDRQLTAAVTINALGSGAGEPDGVFYSATHGLELNGGNQYLAIRAMGNQGHGIVWKNGFSGIVTGVIHHNAADYAALKGEGGTVEIKDITLVDKDISAGTAIELSGGGSHKMVNVVVQGFSACLQIKDTTTQASISDSVLYCDNTIQPAADGNQQAEQAVSSAVDLYQSENPDLTTLLLIDNPNIELKGVGPFATPGGASTGPIIVAGYNLGLFYQPCFAVGTPLDETINIGVTEYNICELEGLVNSNFTFDDAINEEPVAWVLKGDVVLGESFSGLSQQQQQQRLAAPQKIRASRQSIILARAGAALIVNPGVDFKAKGSPASAVTISSMDADSSGAGEWAGITVNGIADSCANAELCRLAQQPLIDIQYLRILEAGGGAPALTLNQVSSGAQISYLDIAGSGAEGVVINGGAVNIDNLLMTDIAGDQLQWQQGYRGTIQYAILKSGDNSSGHAVVGRNWADNHNAEPRSRPVLANITLVGTDKTDTAILLEQGSGLLLYNSVVSGFNTCFDIDDAATAALQSRSPQAIFFDDVVLDCTATLAADQEAGGADYGATTQSLSGVYEVAAVLNAQFVATGADIPAMGNPIDFSLAGTAADYLDADSAYLGAVNDDEDIWYVGWSDSLAVQLAAECDYKGVLEEGYSYHTNEIIDGYYHPFKVCGLRGTLKEDLVLTTYTGADAIAAANETGVPDQLPNGDPIEWPAPLPTLWLLKGLVRVGEGHLLLTDLAQVEAMKANPVHLTIEQGAMVMASVGGGLHITRGGALTVLGEAHIVNTDNVSGPVNMFGLPVDETIDWDDYAPFSEDVKPWAGLIVDGFARNNQCPQAMAEPGSKICNIQGQYGYYGGYDNDHGNMDINNLRMRAGHLALNSVGRGSALFNYHYYLSTRKGELAPERFGDPSVHIDGGAVNANNLMMSSFYSYSSSLLAWDHGYQGTLQSVYLQAEHRVYEDLPLDDDGNFYPLVAGSNGQAGDLDALPRSMPTIANLTVEYEEYDPYPQVSSLIKLSRGSGLFLYNSLLGSNYRDYDKGESPDWCFKVDASVEALAGTELLVNNLAVSCSTLSNNPNFEAAMSASPTSNINQFTAAISYRSSMAQYVDDGTVPGFSYMTLWDQSFAAPAVVALGKKGIDFSTSKTVDMDFIVDADHYGSANYFMITEGGGVIED